MYIITYLKKLFSKKPKIVVVLGQTSTGKSDLAVEIAQKYDGEIISADSRQVYQGMDLGSGKITKTEMQGVPHHLLDVANPKDIFTAHDFQRLGTEAIQKILSKKKLPIICGGTGFYIESLVHQSTFCPTPANPKLRKQYEQKNTKELADILSKEYPKEAKKVDLNNKVRIIRALEICKAHGKIPKIQKKSPYKILFIGLQIPKEKLHERIHRRIIFRLEKGMLNEARKLLAQGVSHKRLQDLGLEYRYMSKHLLGEINKQEMIDGLSRDTIKFAKRQKTWFKRNKKIHWFNPFSEKKEIHATTRNFLN